MRPTSAAIAIAVLAVSGSLAHAQILSSKRGFADTGANYNNLQATNAGWYYTWGTGTGSPGNFDAKNYPMIWGGTPSQGTLNNIIARNPDYVLGFNEPERSDQANMTVAQAISSWTTMSNAFTGTNIKLVSPAVADTGGATGGQQWLSSFMSQANSAGLKVDAVAFHWYGVSTPNDPAGAASSFLGRVQSYFNTYQKPVFITEFAIHDWGGNYTDAEIAEANRQFLNIVIPQLESRSYVAGYAWYHWFGDSRLYTDTGGALTPTPLSYSYIGAVGPGATTNVGGQNLGEHVAPLTGGTLTMTGSAGTLRYINALEGESSITGSVDWSLAGITHWTRIQNGAKLVKTGSNTITFGAGTMLNNGTLEVTQGRLNLGSNVTGSGSIRVKGGTLGLSALATLRFVPLIDVRAGGTLDASGLGGSSLSLIDGRTLNNAGTIVGNVITSAGAKYYGSGTITGNLTASTSGIVRVGTDRLGTATRFVTDNFESYATGDVVNVAASTWTAHQGSTAIDIESVNGNKVLSFGGTSTFVGASRTLPNEAVLDNASTGTYFFRVNAIADNLNHAIGVGDAAQTGAVDFADFETQLRLKQGTSAGTFAIDARNGGAFTSTLASGLALNTWYNVWMVVNNATDRYDLYWSTGTGDAAAANKLNASPLAFRNGTTQELDTFLAYAGAVPTANGVRLDNLVFQAGIDLTNPTANFNPNYSWTPQAMRVDGNFTHNASAILQMDLGTAAGSLVADSISVGGAATLSGRLDLQLNTSFVPTLLQSAQLLEASSVSGLFQSIDGVPLGNGLGLAVTYGAGEVRVTVATQGDANLDGTVNFDDLLALAQHYDSAATEQWATGDFTGNGLVNFDDLLALAQNYQSAGLSTFEQDWTLARSLVPEPVTFTGIALIVPTMCRRNRK